MHKYVHIARWAPIAMFILQVCAMRFCSVTNAGTIWNKFLLCRRSSDRRFVETSGPLDLRQLFNPAAQVMVEHASDQPSLRRTLPTHCRTLEVINPAATVLVEPTLIANTKLDAKPCGNAPEHHICNGSCDQSALSKCAHEFGGYQTPKWYQLLSMHT